MTNELEKLVRAAGEAVNTGRWNDAEALWREVHRLDPGNPAALFSLGVHALRARNAATAVKLLDQARAAAPRDLLTLLTLARARREVKDELGEAEALDAALAIDPYFLPAMLAKAARLERLGETPAAAMLYRNAVKIAGPDQLWPDMLRAQLVQARTFFEHHSAGLHAHLETATAPLLAALPRAEAERWREAAAIIAGRSEPYRQHANQLYVPRLPAIPFYDRALFPWAAGLEAKTDVIRAELQSALAKEQREFAPYIAIRPGQPVDQWAPLNHSARWSHYGLWRNGQPDEAHLAQCPETCKALEALDMAAIDGLCPNAMFSALAPHTEIPPHTGETNARLVVHLPLIVPEKCSYRVGFEHRTWKEGEVLIFDDTIEHAARNDSDALRVVLIFDVWNPLLSPAERDMVRALAAASRAYTAPSIAAT